MLSGWEYALAVLLRWRRRSDVRGQRRSPCGSQSTVVPTTFANSSAGYCLPRSLAAIEENVRDFLINEVFYDKALDTNALGPTDPLVGLLTALDITRLVSFCEESFGIEIPNSAILPEHFETIRSSAEPIASVASR